MVAIAEKKEPSDEVTRLIETVERLPMDDQQRILRIVDLLLVAPHEVRGHTQGMLRALLAREPGSKAECVTGVEEVIFFLEQSLAHRGLGQAALATRH
jgi:hypothetical protein